VAIKIKFPGWGKPVKKGSRPAARNGTRASASSGHFTLNDPVVKLFASGFLIAAVIFMAVFAYFYVKYSRVVDRRMAGPVFSNAAKIYARPKTVSVGEKLDAQEIAANLRRAGYTEQGTQDGSQQGHYRFVRGGIEVLPGPQSVEPDKAAVIRFEGGKVSAIEATGHEGDSYDLEPVLVTALFEGSDRAKRQLIKFDELPKNLVNAIVAIEDRRFFQHSGVNYYRLVEAGLTDVMHGHRSQGGSTLTMQLSRGFFLTPEKTVKRKMTEMLIAMDLEQKFSKQEIFQMYANQVPLGQRGTYSIMGVGEAARAYFNKDVKNLTLPECALIAGIIQRPSYLSPYRHPERALERRNLVLDSMVETGAITRDEADRAKAMPLKLAPPNVEASDAPYFVDLVKDQLSNQFSENDLNQQALRIYTTIDPDLQRAASEAVDEGMKLVDEQVTKMRTKKAKVGTGKNAKTETTVANGPMPQVALIALDPHTGEVLALVGGRNYGLSQLNHAVAKRPTGSIFKPFVYATAVNSALNGGTIPVESPSGDGTTMTTANAVFTPATLLDDSQVSIQYGDKLYEPHNYHDTYKGEVTARYALAMSLNNATVRLAEEVGFDKVASLAKAAGISSVHATPSIALGSYDATPLEMAGAYTVFANGGNRLSPQMVRAVHDSSGKELDSYDGNSKQVLDPRVAYVLTTMMQSVIDSGTGYPVRARGFTAPAAGKTGTSHDAWFAGYTSNLLCIVWVGNDDYTDIKLAGGAAAAPIWAEFMKRAVKVPQYADPKSFSAPQGVVVEQIDKVTNKLATPSCPQTYTVAFLAGTEPKETCEQAFVDNRGVFNKILGIGSPPAQPPPPDTNGMVQPAVGAPPPIGQQPGTQAAEVQPKKKPGFWGRLFGKGGHEDQQPAQNSGQANSGQTSDKGNKNPPE
jgi:penicillin-binding protein 1B